MTFSINTKFLVQFEKTHLSLVVDWKNFVTYKKTTAFKALGNFIATVR